MEEAALLLLRFTMQKENNGDYVNQRDLLESDSDNKSKRLDNKQ